MPARATVAIIATIAGIVLLFSFQTPDITATGPQRSSSVRSSPQPSALAQGAGPAPTPSNQPSTTATPTPSAAASRFKDGRYTGGDITTRYGDVQVRVVVSRGAISDVQSVTLPSDRQRSAEISQEAGPMLHDEVLQAQSAEIDSLSGATYTSDAYAQSVQSALDQAHA